jgi:8-oxo-dGTP pyrophosphatase MutT (NUDIX family)
MAQSAIPLPASTVVLIRPDQNHGFEIYLNRRPKQMDTYAGAYVFPGGRVEESDWSTGMIRLTQGLTPVEAQKKLGVEDRPERCLGYWVAAVRELFEEVGIHFFVSQRNSETISSQHKLFDRMAAKRMSLQRGEIDFADLLVSERLRCDLARLTYFFHRITPEHYRVRFDTRFYLAALPPDQSPLDAAEEVSESVWLSPKAALDLAQADNFPLMPPTLMVLRSLSAHGTWEELRDTYNLR